MSRQEDNKKIVAMLEQLVMKYPDLRFQQILYNFGVVETKFNNETNQNEVENLYYEESTRTLSRLRQVQERYVEVDEMRNRAWEDYSHGY